VDSKLEPGQGKDVIALKESKVKLWTAVIGLAAALVAALGAWGLTVKKANEANGQSNAPASEIQTLRESSQNLAEQLAAAQAKIDQLEAQAGKSTPRAPSGETSSESPVPASRVYHAGPAILKHDISANLDALPDNYQFDTFGAVGELQFYYSDLGTSSGSSVAIKKAGSYDVCNRAVGYSAATYGQFALRQKPTICVRTDEGRISVVQVESATADEVKLQITTYRKDGE
jgi:hypothetical protein